MIFYQINYNINKFSRSKQPVWWKGALLCKITRQCRWNVTMRKTSNYYILLFWVFVFVDLDTQCARALLYCSLWSVRLYHIFPNYLINVTIFWKKLLQHKMWVLIFSTHLSATFLILRRTVPGIVTIAQIYSCKVPLLLSDFNENLSFSAEFRKNDKI